MVLSLRRQERRSFPANHLLAGSIIERSSDHRQSLRLKDVPPQWNIIRLDIGVIKADMSVAFSPTLCFAPTCPDQDTDAQFREAVRAKVAAGSIVQISFSGNGTLASSANVANFVDGIQRLIATYGFNGVNVNVPTIGCATSGDFTVPTDFASTSLINAMKQLRTTSHGNLTLSLDSLFVFNDTGTLRPSDGCLSVVHALRDVVDFMSIDTPPLTDPFVAPDGHLSVPAFSADYWAVMTDIMSDPNGIRLIDSSVVFPALKPQQLYLALNTNTVIEPLATIFAMRCITLGTDCGLYKPRRLDPAFRGFLVKDISWDVLVQGGTYQSQLKPLLESLDATASSSSALPPLTTTSSSSSSPSVSQNISKHSTASPPILAITLPLVFGFLAIFSGILWWYYVRRRRRQQRASTTRPFVASASFTDETKRQRLLSSKGDPAPESSPLNNDNISGPENLGELRSALQDAGFSVGALVASLRRVRDDSDVEGSPPVYRDN